LAAPQAVTPGGAIMTANDPALMTTAYERVCDSYQAFDDFRTKLLGLLPTATGTGVFMLLSGESDLLDSHKCGGPLGAIGAVGFLFTLGLFAYELYGIKKCYCLIETGKRLELEFGIAGQFSTNHFSDVVTVLDLQTYSVVTSIPVGDGPHSLEVSPDGTRVAVVNYISGDVSIIDPTTNAVVGTVPSVGAGPQDVTYARTTGTSTRPMWTTARWRSSMRAAAPKPRGSPPAAARRASR
jgi:YVTN family beta-propeller protein